MDFSMLSLLFILSLCQGIKITTLPVQTPRAFGASTLVTFWSTQEAREVNYGVYAGGADTSAYYSAVDVFDYQNQKWNFGKFHLTSPRISPAAASFNSYALIGGGSDALVSQTGPVDVYDFATNNVSRFNLALNRQSLAAATAGSMVLFAGGNVPYKGITSLVDIFDFTSGFPPKQAVSKLSAARAYMTSIGYQNRAFFAGGLGISNRLLASVEVFDSDTSTWSTVNLSYAREAIYVVHVAQYLIFGTGFPGLRGIDIYDTIYDRWNTSQAPTQRINGIALAVGNQAVFLLGEDNSGNYLSSATAYNPITATWQSMTNVAVGVFASAISCVNGSIVVGGYSSSGYLTTSLLITEN